MYYRRLQKYNRDSYCLILVMLEISGNWSIVAKILTHTSRNLCWNWLTKLGNVKGETLLMNLCRTVTINVCQELVVFVKKSPLGDLYRGRLCIVPFFFFFFFFWGGGYKHFLYSVFPDLGKQKATKSGWYVVCWKDAVTEWFYRQYMSSPKYLSRRKTQTDWGTILVCIMCWRSKDSRTITDLQFQVYELTCQIRIDI